VANSNDDENEMDFVIVFDSLETAVESEVCFFEKFGQRYTLQRGPDADEVAWRFFADTGIAPSRFKVYNRGIEKTFAH
jgi:hypothetical protein